MLVIQTMVRGEEITPRARPRPASPERHGAVR